MFGGRRLVLFGALGAASALTVALGVTDPAVVPGYPTRFLVWNLILAWIPLVFALGFRFARHRWALVLTGVAWLAFLPNAPYLITDLVHLEAATNSRAPIANVRSTGVAVAVATFFAIAYLTIWALDEPIARPNDRE